MKPIDQNGDVRGAPEAARQVSPAGSSVGESLEVEPLEERALLASAAATPVAEPPPAEPAPYVAQQHGPHVEIDIGDSLSTELPSDAPDSGQAVPGVSPAGQHASHTPEAHVEPAGAEGKVENHETRTTENSDLGLGEPNRDEFGLATIEPESRGPEAARLSPENAALRTLAVPEVAAEIDTGVLSAAGVMTPGTQTARLQTEARAEGPAENPADIVAQAVLKAETSSVNVEPHPLQDEAAGTSEQTRPEAHDALFDGGTGVEAVLSPPTPAARAQPVEGP
ncbi:MAG TPA: hypothetical protein VJ783_20555 [Pirellulales bacterium]|nr:hypothetical protein [Pirellulales bacterium]